MTQPKTDLFQDASGDDMSLFSLGTTLLRHRWKVVLWMAIGGLLAGLSVVSKPSLFRASASFMPQGNDAVRSGLATLAGQFGVSVPSGAQSLSPDFYAKLVKSRVLLQGISRDTFVVQEMGGQPFSFLDLFDIQGESTVRREEQAEALLAGIVTASVARNTGIVDLYVETRWPSVSVAIVSQLVSEVNSFNRNRLQGQATAERAFVEGRLAVVGADLRASEDRLERFLKTNKQFGGSPELTFERERLQRVVTLQQDVFTALTQSYEEARIREVRDIPVITVLEPPSVSTQPRPRGRVRSVALGVILGGFVGVLLVFVSASFSRNLREGGREADEFVGTVREVQAEVMSPARWIRDLLRG